nr:MAG TPA: hypothetical protein [Caudoviricetes sp.]
MFSSEIGSPYHQNHQKLNDFHRMAFHAGLQAVSRFDPSKTPKKCN